MAVEQHITESETQAASPEAHSSSAQLLRDKRIVPEGVVPKQAQGYVVAGLAVLILMAVMFSKNHAKPAPKDTASAPLAASTDLNQRKIQELEQDLSADQRQSQQQQMAQRASTASPPNGAAAATNPVQPDVAAPAAQLPPAGEAQTNEAPRDPIADAEKALAFKARFASNLVSADNSASRSSSAPASLGNNPPARSASYRRMVLRSLP